MKRRIVLLLTGLACIGCQSRPRPYWFHPDRTLEEATADCRQCDRHASARAQEEHFGRYQESIEHGRPWQMGSEANEEANRDMDEAYSFDACMTSRGYRKVSAFRLGSEIQTRRCFGGDELQRLAGQ